MSGHSKWSTIKRQKGAADAKRSTVFTKLANLISIAAREGGGDLGSNFKLRLAVEKARAANMPKDNIDRAIKRGTGELGGAALEDIMYEAYAPGGVALLIQVTTDNRNRSVANVKSVLNKYSAKLAETGSVGYLFKQKGTMLVQGSDAEVAELAIIENGADDYAAHEDGTFSVYTVPQETMAVAKALEASGLQVSDIELSMEPLSTILVEDEKVARQLVTIIEQLEDIEDVSNVYSNFDIAEGVAL
jgi:YebC/PmpR family DNA-binding regulatory protein